MNVLLVTIDSLRADRVLEDNALTPRMDALAGDGAQFVDAATHGHGTPVAFPSILSGTYPMLYGGCDRLSPDRPVLARELADAGYRTAAFTSNPHLFDKYGYDIGFDDFNAFRVPTIPAEMVRSPSGSVSGAPSSPEYPREPRCIVCSGDSTTSC